MSKKDYEIAVDAYVEAERAYRQLEESLLSGEVIATIVKLSGGDTERAKAEFTSFIDVLKTRLEDMNAKFVEAKNMMRQAVQISFLNQRGPSGDASTLRYGPFYVSSTTTRWLDPKTLLRGAARHGVLDRLLTLTSFDKDGKEYKLVEQSWKIDYENVSKWLREQGLQAVLDGAYDEMEQTPRVTGPKALAFLGDKITT
jgi:hypothetical protein